MTELILTDRAALKLIDQAERALAQADNADDADELWRKVKAVEEAAHLARVSEVAVLGLRRVQLRAKRRYGELLPEPESKGRPAKKEQRVPLPKADRVAADRARKLAAVPEETFEKTLAAESIEKVSEAAILREDRKSKATERRSRSRGAEPLADGMDLRIGDAREILADVEDGSVGLVLTDPPYGDEAEPLYRWLAEWSARVLIPGGSLICFTGQSRLDRDMRILGEQLRYWWCLSMPHNQSQRLAGKFVIAE